MLLNRLGVEPGASMADIMARHKNMGPGFDFIRIGLSTLILYLHCRWLVGTSVVNAVVAVSQVQDAAAPVTAAARVPHDFAWQQPIHAMLVPMFFAVSGFLVTGSAIRLRKTTTFLWFRVLRLLPALITEVTLSALILGPALTILPLGTYFRDPLFAAYFLNIVGHVQFLLPGVFGANPVAYVNMNLWTLPGEFWCYFVTTIGMVTTAIYRPQMLAVMFAVGSVLLIAANIGAGYDPGRLVSLVYYFFVGVLFYHFRDRVRLSGGYFLGAAVLAYGLGAVPWGLYLAPIFVCYVILFIGMLSIPRIPLLQRGDYSYGIYLYGFPISQALMALVPSLRGHSAALFLLGFPATLLFAVASWHFIEKPALKLKKALSRKTIPVSPEERIAPAVS